MVGRLVKEQDLVISREHPRQGDPSPLPAAQLPDPGIPGQVANEPFEDVADARISGPDVFGRVADDRRADG